jgi:hypothetical protein
MSNIESKLSPIQSLKPSECKAWKEPDGYRLVGDYHLSRGGFTVIGGPAGVGKSRAIIQLAISAATGADWFDLPVHGQFKTYILQDENGRHRLKEDFAKVETEIDEFIRVTPPLECGMSFSKQEFRDNFTKELADFGPDIVVIDPWINAARDCTQSDYSDLFDYIRECMPKGEKAPAIVIVAHTRKPQAERCSTGTGLLHELIGSTKLGSVPRSVFVIQSASNDTEDNRIVFTCCKNNDGQKGQRTAWKRHEGLFSHIDFDWDEFDNPETGRVSIREEDLVALFEGGEQSLKKKDAVAQLMEQTEAKKSAAYQALSLDGRFGAHLCEREGLLHWT